MSQHIATINISPMINENKKCMNEVEDHYHSYDTVEIDENKEESRRPSIPSFVPLKNHGRHLSDDDNMGYNASAPLDDGDDFSRCSFSSLISELTLMTFSEEKAAMLKSEFLSRLQTRQLSMEEKMALLNEIQSDQERKFKMEMQRQEKKRSMERTRHEFFDRLNALRVRMCRDGDQQQPQMEGQNHISERDSSLDRAGGGQYDQDGGVIAMTDSGAEHEEKEKGRQPPCRRASMDRRRSGLNRRRSYLSNSDTTEKRYNSNRSLLANSFGHQNEHMVAAAEVTAASMSSPNSDSESKSCTSTIKTNTTSRVHIEALIELKVEIANQQATIDTITAQLHNLDIVNSRLLSSLSREESARKAADKSNEELTEQLKQCREREVELRREIMASSLTRPVMTKQSSAVDWGDADDDKDGSDDNDNAHSILLDKLKKLQQENEILSKENKRLRYGMSESINTECTEPLTRLDSSERNSLQSRARHQARPEESLGASLRSLGSSMKLPFTKMRRSRSDIGQYNTNYFEEEPLKGRAPSTGTLDDIKDNFLGFATASSGAEEIGNSSPRGINLQAHMKAERRWSTGGGGLQKETVESDGGRGIGGWLNGWRVFGKVVEVDEDGASWTDDMRERNLTR